MFFELFSPPIFTATVLVSKFAKLTSILECRPFSNDVRLLIPVAKIVFVPVAGIRTVKCEILVVGSLIWVLPKVINYIKNETEVKVPLTFWECLTLNVWSAKSRSPA